jgi:hypothetical protein
VMQNALRASRVNICFGSFLLENATLKYKEATVHINRTSCYADMIETIMASLKSLHAAMLFKLIFNILKSASSCCTLVRSQMVPYENTQVIPVY